MRVGVGRYWRAIAGALCILLLNGAGLISDRDDDDDDFHQILPGNKAWDEVAARNAEAMRLFRAQTQSGSSVTWQPLGSGIGAPNGSGLYPVSGRVTAIAIDPTDSNTIYLGSNTGGVWKTTNGGTSWTVLTDQACSSVIATVVIDPVNPQIVYAGTGNGGNGIGFGGCGILRSADGGQSWTQLPFNNSWINGMVIQPSTAGSLNSTTLVVSSAFGIYRSTNSGASFSQVLNASINGLTASPANASVLYAGNSGTTPLYKSTDGGATWNASGTGLPSTAGPVYWQVVVAVSPLTPSVLLAIVGGNPTGGYSQPTLYSSVDSGASWTPVTAAGKAISCQCGYDLVAAFDPRSASAVYLGGTPFYKSTDGGTTWADITTNNNTSMHLDQHVITFDAQGRMYVGNDGGIWRSDDGGDHWINLNANLGTVQFYHISVHPTDPDIILGGSQDNGSDLYSANQTWSQVGSGDGGFNAFDFTVPTTFYVKSNGYVQRFDAGGPNLNTSSTYKMNGISEGYCGPLAMNPGNSSTLVCGTTKIYQTTNRADNWTAISPDFQDSFDHLAYAPSAPQTTIYAETFTKLKRTTNGGGTWSDITGNLPAPLFAIAVDPLNPDIALVSAANKALYRTADGGKTWQAANGNLPSPGANAITITADPVTSVRTTYICGDYGCYVSKDNGVTWQSFNNGLPNVVVDDVVVNTKTGYIYAGTYGRGLYRAPLAAAGAAQTITFAAIPNAGFSVAPIALTATSSSGLPVTFTSTTASVCATSGSTVTLFSIGTCTVVAAQPGNATYAPAASVSQSFTVSKGSQTITFTVPPSAAFPGIAFSVLATANSGLAVSVASTTLAICTVSGLQVTPLATGTCTLTASQVGNTNYAAATSVTQVVTIQSASSIPQPTGGIANAASAGQATPGVVAPGSYIAIYGSQLAGTGNSTATALPLPLTLNSTQATLGGLPMPLLYAGSGQLNALVPQGLKPNQSYPLLVQVGSVTSSPVQLFVQELQPGIYTVNTSGSGAAIVADAFTGQLISAQQPAHAGEYLVIYCTGLGMVLGPNGEAAPMDGAVAPSTLVYSTVATITATVGGVTAPVLFSGLTPTFAGLYQVNIQVPSGITPSGGATLSISAADTATGASAKSNSVTLAVQ